MKKIEAIIRTTKFEEVKRALEAAGHVSLTMIEVKGRGQQKGIRQQWRGAEYVIDMIPKTKIEIVVEDQDADAIVETILRHARTGQAGDGKIFIIPVENAIRVRTGDEGSTAL
ncbi:MAG: P-II family nitrogen regulator [Methanomicrobiaceae archaeon]|nr:P-II family nitrogen regulator [Methanomicrobiaceae archaeon]